MSWFPKKNPTPTDSHRVTTNFIRLNQVTVRDACPLPRISDALDSPGGSKFFTTLDANSGFFQIPMNEKDQEKVTMTTYEGLFSCKRMPLGLTNSPPAFQRLMDLVMSGIKWKFCMVCLDDIVIFSKTFEEHLDHLQTVLGRLRDAGISLRLRKCHFAKGSLDCLGCVVSEEGWRPNPKKVEAIKAMVAPRNQTEVRAFLGMMGFFRMFVRNCAETARWVGARRPTYLLNFYVRFRLNLCGREI